MATYLIKKKYAETKTNIDDGKWRIITMPANLVKGEIREKYYSMDVYPNSTQIKQLLGTKKFESILATNYK